MNVCNYCGNTLLENTKFCPNCGKSTENQIVVNNVNIEKSGMATASVALGIVGVIFATIGVFITLCCFIYSMGGGYDYYTKKDTLGPALAIFLAFLPGVMTLTGFLLSIFCRKKIGKRIAGIVLNSVGIALTVLIIILSLNV